MKKRLLILAVLAMPALLIIVRMGMYAFAQTSAYSDLTISHLPYAEFIRTSLLSTGDLPLWYPGLFGGIPLSAQPLAGMWYLPGWIGILIPAPYGFNLAFAIHLFAGGMGMYVFLRGQRIGSIAALLGGLAFELTPKLFAHFAAGHISWCFAYSLTPWLLATESLAVGRNYWRWRIIGGAVLGLIVLADIRWAAYAGCLWMGWRIYQYLVHPGERGGVLKWAGGCLGVILEAALIAAPFWLDFAQFTTLSTRTGLIGSQKSGFLLPVDNLLGMLYPPIGGYVEWVFYPGMLTLLFTGWLAGSKGGWRRIGFWLSVMLVSLIVSVGWLDLSRLPLISLMRVPSRALMVFDFSGVILLGIGMDVFFRREKSGITLRPASWLAAAGLGGLAILLGIVVWMVTKTLPLPFMWGTIAAGCSLAVLYLSRWQPLSIRSLILLATAILVLDLGGAAYSQLRWMPRSVVDSDGEELAAQLKQLSTGRIYSPNYQIPQLAAERARLSLISGIDPMQLSSFSDYLYAAANIPVQGYSVPLPPLNQTPVQLSNQGIVPDAEKMGWMAVDIMATSGTLENPRNWQYLETFAGTAIYKNLAARPQAWVQAEDNGVGAVIRQATITSYSANRIILQAAGPGTLVLAEQAYPGWHVTVDGKSAQIAVIENLLRAVKIPEGDHSIEFYYKPEWLNAGLACGIAGWLLVTITSLRRRHH